MQYSVCTYMYLPWYDLYSSNFRGFYITQYGVYRDCHGWSSIIAIHKDITFSFNLSLSFKDIKL